MPDFVLPNLGEGVAQGDVLKVLVKPGDTVAKDQAVLELETDKATVEVPSTVAGVVREVRVKVGDKVTPGQPVLSFGDGDGAPAAAAPPADAPLAADSRPTGGEAPAAGAASGAPSEVVAEVRADEGRDTPAAPAEASNASGISPPAPSAERPRAPVVDINQGRSSSSIAPSAAPAPASSAAPASPSVRRLAREIGVDINLVTGSGPLGRISQDDVKEFSRRVMSSLGSGGQGAMAAATDRDDARPGMATLPLPDLAKWGEIERKPMTGVRRKTAEHLSHAWATIPHVTQFDKADITHLEALRRKFGPEVERSGGKLTVTAIVAKVLASALRVFPEFNAAVDAAGDALVYRKYVHVGIAVDTDHGLLVPVIRNADQKSIVQLAGEIQQLAEKARARKLSLGEMSGGSMSITNLGGIGGTAFTPIVNWPEVAILALSRGQTEPVWIDGAFQPRTMLPLSLSYDHRIIDGANAIRFLRWVIDALEQPFAMALRG